MFNEFFLCNFIRFQIDFLFPKLHFCLICFARMFRKAKFSYKLNKWLYNFVFMFLACNLSLILHWNYGTHFMIIIIIIFHFIFFDFYIELLFDRTFCGISLCHVVMRWTKWKKKIFWAKTIFRMICTNFGFSFVLK